MALSPRVAGEEEAVGHSELQLAEKMKQKNGGGKSLDRIFFRGFPEVLCRMTVSGEGRGRGPERRGWEQAALDRSHSHSPAT